MSTLSFLSLHPFSILTPTLLQSLSLSSLSLSIGTAIRRRRYTVHRRAGRPLCYQRLFLSFHSKGSTKLQDFIAYEKIGVLGKSLN
ncbi:hypothetical protein L6452_21207 [Arctium lappa]|uniref:Uncharacterized protein n=1 Tax=Arctium lappa TaxID=4217 RepID=A0ACB9BCP9_ARCLA|nr:hypothetical protein L6452_21207 [Arctium lappa]